jgi:hypothetical protein
VKWVSALYLHSTSEIKINGEIGGVFNLHRLVRQGCPLAPYLSILAIDVLGYMLQDPKAKAKGLTLLKGRILRTRILLMILPFI